MQKSLRLLVGILLGVLVFARPGEPQGEPPAQPPTRSVKVDEAEQGRMHWLLPKINQEVINAFAAKVAATSRYTLTQYSVTQAPPEILVVIVCEDRAKGGEMPRKVAAGFCTYKIEYSPKKIPEFNMPLGEPKVISGTDPSGIAEDIFEEFVKETTETRLSSAETEVTLRVANFCSKPENQLPCSGKFQ